MQHPKPRQHGLWPQPQRRRLAGVKLLSSVSHNLQTIHRRARLRQQSQRLGLGIEGIERHRLALRPAARSLLAHQHHAQRQPLITAPIAATQIAPPDLEQPQPTRPAIQIPPRRAQQPRQQRGPHRLHVLADRIGEQPQFTIRKPLRLTLGQKAPGNRLVQPPRRRRPAQPPLELLRRRGGGPGHTIRARQGNRSDIVEPVYPHDLFHNIRRAIHIGPPAGGGDCPIRRRRKPQRGENAPLLTLGNLHPAQRRRELGIISHLPARPRSHTRAHHFAGLAAANLQYQPGQDIEALIQKRRIHPPLKPPTRIRGQVQLAPGGGNPLRIEIGDLQQHIARRLRATRMLATHDPGDVMHPGVIGDHRHAGVQRVFLAVQGQTHLALARRPRHHIPAQLRQIIGMRRATIGQHHVIGDVHQRADRPLPRAGQPIRQPLRARPIGHTPNHPAIKGGAPFVILKANRGRAGERPRHARRRNRLQRTQARRRQIARNAINAHAIGPVGRNRHLQHRIGPMIIGKRHTHRGILGQLDDALVCPRIVKRQLQLARRAHHAVGGNPAHGGNLQHHAIGRHHRARRPQHADQPRPRIGRPAHHLQRLAISSVYGQHLQLVGIGMRPGGQDLRHAKASQLGGGILDPLHLQPNGVQLGGNRLHRGVGIEVVLQPRERELHATTPPATTPTPAERVGTSSAEKP